MKRILLIAGLAIAIFSCSKEDACIENNMLNSDGNKQVYHATTEGVPVSGTKVYADEDLKVLWNADDRISVFAGTTALRQYIFMGNDGDTGGDFEEVSDNKLRAGDPLPHNYAIYPHNPDNDIRYDARITVNLPAEQSYKEHSFGIGANTMVAVTDDYYLPFKNVCGYLKFRFYGDDVQVKSIKLEGNNGEKIAGTAYITASLEDAPSVTMDETATTSITINCEEPVTLGTSSTDFTEFIFVIPPTTFSNGFKISVTDMSGKVFERKMNSSITISRNKIEAMTVKKVVYDYASDYFTIRCLEDGTLTWDTENVEYSLDLTTWNSWTGSLAFAKNDYIRFRGNNSAYTDKNIRSTGKIKVEGNILSLLYSSDFIGKTTLIVSSDEIKDQFKDLFKDCLNLLSAEHLILPVADTEGCFNRLFENCKNLTLAPSLNATKLEKLCYTSMFKDCSSLITSPYLAVENVPWAAYNGMYQGCTSITSATILGKTYGYYACNFMFKGCTKLNTIKCLNEQTIYARFQDWVEGVSSTGTFIKSKNFDGWDNGFGGIPEGWTIVDDD